MFTLTIRVVSSEISGGIFPEISGKITVLFRNNSAEKRTCQLKLLHILDQCPHFETYFSANLVTLVWSAVKITECS